MYPGYTLCERQTKILFEIGKLIFEIRKQVLCKHLWGVKLEILGQVEPVQIFTYVGTEIYTGICETLKKFYILVSQKKHYQYKNAKKTLKLLVNYVASI